MTNSTVEVVRLTGLSKSFTLRTEKSLKETVLNFFAKRKRSHKFQALNGIDLSIESGSTIGLIGHNGSGKSTLLKIIGGILEPTEGVVQRRGKLAALLELGAGFHPDLTGRENVYLNASILGLSKAEVDEKFADIVDFSGINEFIDTQVKFYSSGMYVRLAFAVAVNVDPDILLVDEVLAVGDELFQQKCINKIKEFQQQGRTIIIVSHAADQIKDLCDTVLLLEQGVPTYLGEPVEGIRLLRRSLRERDGQEEEQGPAGGPIERFSIRVLSGEGTSKKRFSSDSEFVLETSFSIKSDKREALAIELVLTSHSGHEFVCASEEQEQVLVSAEDSQYTVAFTVSPTHLLPLGSYSCAARVKTPAGETLAEVTKRDSFTLIRSTKAALDRPYVQGSFVVASVE
jgi:ABC-2 type transport system ATP-binding protein